MVIDSVVAEAIVQEMGNLSHFPGEELVLNEPQKWMSIDRCSQLCNAAIVHNAGWFWFYIVILLLVTAFIFFLLLRINSRLKALRAKEAELGIKHEPVFDVRKIIEGLEEEKK